MSATLRQLRYLLTLTEVCNFSRAAEKCLVTQSTLSGGIQDLEAILGVTLFERTKRKVIATPIGLELARRAQLILSQVDDLMETAKAGTDFMSGPLRLGVIPTIGPFLLPRILPKLAQEYPDLKLILREDQTANLLRLLAAGELDLLILAFPYTAPGTEHFIVADDPFWFACPRDHALAHERPARVSAIDPTEMLLLEDGHCLRDHALTACQLQAAAVTGRVQATSLYTLVQMVAGGLGVSLVPEIAVTSDMLRGIDVTLTPLEASAAPRQIGLTWRATSGQSEQFRILGEMLEQELRHG